MTAKLLYRDGQGTDAAADLPTEGGFLGRGLDCVVRTDDAMASRKHCKLFLEEDRWFAEDMGSANGTYVNDQRIQRHELQHGDVIRCGSLQVRFVEIRPAAPPAPPSGLSSRKSVKPPPPPSDRGTAPRPPIPPQSSAPPRPREVAATEASADPTGFLPGAVAVPIVDPAPELIAEAAPRPRPVALESEIKSLRAELVRERLQVEQARRDAERAIADAREQVRAVEALRAEAQKARAAVEEAADRAAEQRIEIGGLSQELSESQEARRLLDAEAKAQNAQVAEARRARAAAEAALEAHKTQIEELRAAASAQAEAIGQERAAQGGRVEDLASLRQRSAELEQALLGAQAERDALYGRNDELQRREQDLLVKLNALSSSVASLEQERAQRGEQAAAIDAVREELAATQRRAQETDAALRRAQEELLRLRSETAQLAADRAVLARQLKAAEETTEEVRQQAASAQLSATARGALDELLEERAQLLEERAQLLAARGQAAARVSALESDCAQAGEAQRQALAEIDSLRQLLEAAEIDRKAAAQVLEEATLRLSVAPDQGAMERMRQDLSNERDTAVARWRELEAAMVSAAIEHQRSEEEKRQLAQENRRLEQSRAEAAEQTALLRAERDATVGEQDSLREEALQELGELRAMHATQAALLEGKLSELRAARADGEEMGSKILNISEAMAALKEERDALLARLTASEELHSELASDGERLLARMVADTDAWTRERSTLAEQLAAALAAAPAAVAPTGDREQEIDELRQAAQSTYESLNGALRELKTSIELVQDACEAILQSADDRDAARQVREAILQSLERWDFAKGELRTLGAVVQ